MISAAIGLVIWLWLLIIGVDYPVLWGTLSFVLNYVPNIGRCRQYHRTEIDGPGAEPVDAGCFPLVGLLGMDSGTDRHDPLGSDDQPCQDRTGKP